jgi:predicted HicB family RNase H-like nuclease
MSNQMTYRGYCASLTVDTEDKIIVGRVENISDIISFHGETVAEFEANFKMVVDDYITACEQLGALPDKPVSGKMMLRIAPAIHAAAVKKAALSGASLNKWAEQVFASATGFAGLTKAT